MAKPSTNIRPRRRSVIETSTDPPNSNHTLTATYRPPLGPILQHRPVTARGVPDWREAIVEGDGEVDGVRVDGDGVVIGRVVNEDENGNVGDGGIAGGGGRLSRFMIGVGLVIAIVAISFSRARADDDVRYAALAPLCNPVLVYDLTSPDFSTEPHNWVKVLLWGDCGVGESCIVLQFVCGQIDPTSNVTAAASFLSESIALQDSTTVKFEIWDTASQKRYAALAPLYYQGVAVAVVVGDNKLKFFHHHSIGLR